MNRILLLAVVGCALIGNNALAQKDEPKAPPPMGMTPVPAAPAAGPVQGVVGGGCAGCGGANVGYASHDSRFGWNPLFRKLAFWKQSNGCGTCGSNGLFSRLRGLCHGGGCGNSGYGQAPAFNPYPNGVPGTLVFPNHWYTRSPRDFFMLDAR